MMTASVMKAVVNSSIMFLEIRIEWRGNVGPEVEHLVLDPAHDDFFGQPGQMYRAERSGVKIVDHEIAIADGIEAVRGRTVEAKCRGGIVTVDREARSG